MSVAEVPGANLAFVVLYFLLYIKRKLEKGLKTYGDSIDSTVLESKWIGE
jgi:hypothetical protein